MLVKIYCNMVSQISSKTMDYIIIAKKITGQSFEIINKTVKNKNVIPRVDILIKCSTVLKYPQILHMKCNWEKKLYLET